MLKIDHPQVYIYSYQLSRKSGTVNSIWDWANKIWEHFSPKPSLMFSKKHLSYPLTDAEELEYSENIKVFLSFCNLNDGEGISASIGTPEIDKNKDLEVKVLQDFDPDKSLIISPNYEDWLGQTILITYKLPTHISPTTEQLREVADECLKNLLPESLSPTFYRATDLFNSPILEYSFPENQQLQIIVYKIDDQIETNLGNSIQPLFELFYYRHKINKAFIDSRRNYDLVDKLYTEIEQIVQNLKELTTNKELKELKEKINELLYKSLDYQESLQYLEGYKNTISINAYNYQQKLLEISNICEISTEKLSAFTVFIEKTAPYFQRQIQGDLGYFKHGTDLINTAIASIRGIVEIEQAEIDRQRQEQEKESDRQLQITLKNNEIAERNSDQELQNTIQSVGTGIGVGVGVGGIIATSYPLIEKTWQFPSPQQPLLPLHPLIIAITLSLLSGGGLGLFAWWITRKHLRSTSANKQISPIPKSAKIEPK